MKKTLALATFVALGAGTAGAGALNTVPAMLGSDTLKDLTNSVLLACKGATGAGLTPNIVYAGTGSGAGEGSLKDKNETIAPMSRFLAAANTCAFTAGGVADTSEAEALQIGIDGLAIVTNATHRTACEPGNPAGSASNTSCSIGSPAKTGVSYSKATALDCGGGVTLALSGTNGWKEALLLTYFGLKSSALPPVRGAGVAKCLDSCRVALIANWSNFFDNDCSGTGTDGVACVALQHAFRRDENSGTTDAFRDILGARNLAANPLGTFADGNQGFPFCNEYDPTTSAAAAPLCTPKTVGPGVQALEGALPSRPYYELYQDADPIRRTTIGTGNLDIENIQPPPDEPTEQVSSSRRDLGLVIPISVPPLNGTVVTDAERYPMANCSYGFSKPAQAPVISPAVANGDAGDHDAWYALCPNGDMPKKAVWDSTLMVAVGGTGTCLFPVVDADLDPATTGDQDFRCINGRNNVPAAFFAPPTAVADVCTTGYPKTAGSVRNVWDGRAYNLHPHNRLGQYVTQPYTYTGASAPANGTGSRQVVGAFYRMHVTRTALPSAGSAKCAGDICCKQNDSTDQIGCLVAANPCSIGFAGENALNTTVDTLGTDGSVYGASLKAFQPSPGCEKSNQYPLSRPLYYSTMLGFRDGKFACTTDAQCATQYGAGSNGQISKCGSDGLCTGVFGSELALARCVSDTTTALDPAWPNEFLAVPADDRGLDAGNTIASMMIANGFKDVAVGCRSFDDSTCAGGPAKTNSCANNPAGIPKGLAINETCATAADCAVGLVCTSLKCQTP